ncbi:hypothetical protein HKX48_002563 [Thoreauomyces humboldtii]|nr:hypothetical protein HKX48_002563 [Thoreauomyces humboldtii]
MPGTLNNDDDASVRRAIGGGSQVLSSTAARIYTAQNNSWNYTGHVGALVLSRSGSTYRIQLVDVASNQSVWQHDVSDNVKYQQDCSFFHSFIGTEGLVGLSFADEREASEFHSAFNNKESASAAPALTPRSPPGTLPRSQAPAQPSIAVRESFAPPQPQPPQHLPSNVTSGMVHSSSSDSLKAKDSPRSSIFGGFGGSKKAEKKKGGINKATISAPVADSFQHVTHVGYNSQTGFSAKNIPVEWKAIFAKAGITEDQLQDQASVKTIKKFMKNHAAQAKAEATGMVAPPAAPPAIVPSASGCTFLWLATEKHACNPPIKPAFVP